MTMPSVTVEITLELWGAGPDFEKDYSFHVKSGDRTLAYYKNPSEVRAMSASIMDQLMEALR